MPNVGFKGEEISQIQTGSQTWDLVNTSRMLLPTSHLTCGRGVEADFITAMQATGLS